MSGWAERAVAIPRGDADEALEGIYVPAPGDEPDGGALIAPPHPLFGGSMDSPVVNELAWAFRRCGLASLRFNWRGVGASAGAPSGDAADADADYAAALDHLRRTAPGPLLASGYSFGAGSALRVGARERRVQRLLLVAPPPALLDRALLDGFAGRILILTGSHDGIAPPGPLEERARGARHARLVIVPEADHFFLAGLAEISREAAAWLGPPEA